MKRIPILIAALATSSPAFAQAPAPAPAPASAQRIASLQAVKLAVADFEKTTAFYTALGMKPGANRGSNRELNWDAGSHNSGLIIVSPDYARNAKMTYGGTYLMITAPDLKAIAARLRAAGFPDGGEPRASGSMVTLLMLTDPDGNKIELLGPPPAK